MPGFFKRLFKPSATRSRARTVSSPTSTTRRSLTLSRSRTCRPAKPPRLPTELILHIFHLAARDDPKTLAKLSLLCRASNERAQLQLYHHPTLNSIKQLQLFLRTLRKRPKLGQLVLALSLDGSIPTSATAGAEHPDSSQRRATVTGRLPHVLELCPKVTFLEVRHAVVFSLTDFANGTALKDLILRDVLLSDRTTTTRYHPFFTTLPCLTSLSLLSTQWCASTADHFLCPTTLPLVTCLNLSHTTLIDEPSSMRYIGTYTPQLIASQLTHLNLHEDLTPSSLISRRPNDTFPQSTLLTHSDSLLSLSLSLADVTPHLLDTLPPSITHLHLRPPHQPDPVSDIQLARALLLSLLALPSLGTHSGRLTPFVPYSSSSPSTFSSPLNSPTILSPFSTPHHSSSADEEKLALSQLMELRLPKHWSGLQVGEEMGWEVGRVKRWVEREGGGRGVELRFV